jgi:uncharacterized protein (DUF305 family)
MATEHGQHAMTENHYRRLLIMAVLSFASMYVLMYAMVDALENVFTNVNQLYMAGLMTAPMTVIELFVMGSMYRKKRRNALIITGAGVVGTACFAFIRQQTGVSDRQFLRSMIPHHASAILMCKQAPIHDPEIASLCRTIISGQRAEIDQMKAKLGLLHDQASK